MAIQFCKECHQVMNLQHPAKEDGTVDLSRLIYNCLNCGYNEPFDHTSGPVMTDGKVQTLSPLEANPHLIHDPTIPRLKDIQCRNKTCITKSPPEGIEKGIVAIMEDVVEENEIDSIKERWIDKSSSNLEIYRIRPKYLLIIPDKIDKDDLKNAIGEDELDNNQVIGWTQPDISDEIMYLQADRQKMTFLYVCASCGYTWMT